VDLRACRRIPQANAPFIARRGYEVPSRRPKRHAMDALGIPYAK